METEAMASATMTIGNQKRRVVDVGENREKERGEG